MNILLLSAYDAASHQYWRQYLQQKLDHHVWHVHALPPRFFNWRMRGNSLTWAFDQALVPLNQYDCLIATSMVDLSSLRGMLPALCTLPTALYFHENQFAYPPTMSKHSSIEPQMVSLYSAICADYLVFNSAYNLNTFLVGVESLLKKFPDCVPKGVVSALSKKSRCIAVPIQDDGQLPLAKAFYADTKKLSIVWNHRWEYDKGPELLAQCILNLPKNLPLTFHVVGQRFRSSPEVFEQIYSTLQENGWLGSWSYIEDRSEYLNLLANCHVVISTAIHDFQGLAVLEAVAAGCIPVLPNRIVYPEWFAPEFLYEGGAEETQNLCKKLMRLVNNFEMGELPNSPSVANFTWEKLSSEYQQLISELAEKL